MTKITYYLGAGASYNSCPILENQAEMMIKIAEFEIKESTTISDGYGGLTSSIYNFISEELKDLPDNNKIKILWHIGYFGYKAKEYNTIDTYARKLYLNDEIDELNLLKMCVSVFFDLWENFHENRYKELSDSKYIKIDNRYKSIFSILLNKENGIKLNNNFKFITWNYDLQIESAFKMFLKNEEDNDFNRINDHFKFKENQNDSDINDIFHLNGHRGFFTDKNNNEEKEFIIKISNQFDDYWHNIEWLFESTEKGSANFNNFIKYAWEHNLKDNFFNKISKVMNETEVLIIIGYSFPAFNREIDQFLFSKILPNKIKKIIYQDPNGSIQLIENLFEIPDLIKKKIEIISETKSLTQFYLPNNYFITQKKKPGLVWN
ncbi:hypothetical protein [Flavobacterium taihuense]|uniref:SIR2-like domain-containing protein n=1 Tax=Flavobacterium taihuense TaxID=2857508 RepID=A0ABS6XYA1_9FLAO|nr:hypothetical protein [Flavobacterium taihuense]MBW4361637.1 hypothetical protein [Flavobacterium taihuense]